MTESGTIDEEPILVNSPLLKPISVDLAPPRLKRYHAFPPACDDHTNPGPSTYALFPDGLLTRHGSDASSEGLADLHPAMSAPSSSSESTSAHGSSQIPNVDFRLPAIAGAMMNGIASRAEQKAAVLQVTAAAVLQESDKTRGMLEDSGHVTRVDSVQESAPQLALKVETALPASTSWHLNQHEKPLAESPRVGKHVIKCEEESTNRLPIVSPSSAVAAPSPQTQQLPPIRHLHLTSQLSELAEIATQQDPRAQSQALPVQSHSHALGPVAAQSPIYFHSPFPSSGQPSPASYSFGRSPSSAISDPAQTYPRFAPPRDRRASAATDISRGFPPGLHSMRSASSSGESGQAASSADGYSTNHTTPIETPAPPPGTINRTLPPPNGMQFKCEHEGCDAVFSTQYLLSSHKNVHSQVRTHFCPEKDCPRGEGGKGFKRKNEMVRHGLVHKSPGYVCPFCTDLQRRYPRPDNLQRHVRVHHVDKDKDDAALRDVLAQRIEGASRGNRRRRTTVGSANDM